MPGFVMVALLAFWLFTAYSIYRAGNVTAAIIMAVIGLSLAMWRVRSRPH